MGSAIACMVVFGGTFVVYNYTLDEKLTPSMYAVKHAINSHPPIVLSIETLDGHIIELCERVGVEQLSSRLVRDHLLVACAHTGSDIMPTFTEETHELIEEVVKAIRAERVILAVGRSRALAKLTKHAA